MIPDEMTVEDALEEAGMVATFTGESERDLRFSDLTPRAMAILAAEVRRLHAAVERVRALSRFDLDGYEDQCSRVKCSDGEYMGADDVLAALEGE